MKCKLCKNKITGCTVEKIETETNKPVSVPFCIVCWDEVLKGEKSIPSIRLIETGGVSNDR